MEYVSSYTDILNITKDSEYCIVQYDFYDVYNIYPNSYATIFAKFDKNDDRFIASKYEVADGIRDILKNKDITPKFFNTIGYKESNKYTLFLVKIAVYGYNGTFNIPGIIAVTNMEVMSIKDKKYDKNDSSTYYIKSNYRTIPSKKFSTKLEEDESNTEDYGEE